MNRFWIFNLHILAHWNGIFGELDYIPVLVFPFVKLFQHSGLHCFEVVISILFNLCRDWFSFYPNPPISILASIENVISDSVLDEKKKIFLNFYHIFHTIKQKQRMIKCRASFLRYVINNVSLRINDTILYS